ncbi:MAG: replication-associated recombination protein A [Acutalibacteraceae bacterium]|nr:replication-associated recombination protein A [Acutalibacteraceae bacterium]
MAKPLADRMRPEKVENVVGQHHLLDKGKALRSIIDSGRIPNMIFYGPSGIGKTTVASIIAKSANMRLHKLNGTNASTSDIKDIIKEIGSFAAVDGILLYLDEIQYFNKKQQQSLLEYIENGTITLIASTTENPYFYIYNAILSRSTVFEFKPVSTNDVKGAVLRAKDFLEQENSVKIEMSDEVIDTISFGCGGDVRKAINAVELCVLSSPNENSVITVSLDTAKQLSQKSSMRYDKDGDQHYDILSAFQKSMRGSDPDAAIHYLARLLQSGDLQSACRRLLVCACEDVGLAYPQIIPIVKSCVDSALQVGLPEAEIPLADAVIMVALAPKSNSANCAIKAANEDLLNGNYGDIPSHLKDGHYSGANKLGNAIGYKYPHDYENAYIKQQYLPDILKNKKYYEYANNKNEQAFKSYWDKIKK